MTKHESNYPLGRASASAEGSANSTPFRFLCALVTSDLLHLGERVPILGLVRVDLLLFLGAVVSYSLASERSLKPRVAVSLHERNVNKWLIVLFAYILVTLPFVEWPGSVLKNNFLPFLKATAFYFLVVWCIDSPRQLKGFFFLYTALQTFRVLEPVYLHLANGYWGSGTHIGGGEFMLRLSGAPSDVINANGLAYIIVSTLPLIVLLQRSMKLIGKALAWTVVGVMIYGLILTSSRSGFLVFALSLLLWFGKSRHKVALVLGLAGALVVVVPNLTEMQRDRYLSIFQSDTRNSATAQHRLEGVEQDLAVALRRPVFGHGLGTSTEANTKYRGVYQLSHNLYTEVAQELGFVGLGLFLAFVVASVRAALHAVRVSALLGDAESGHIDPTVALVCQGIYVLMGVDLVFSLASYGLSQSHWYLLAGLSVVAVRFMPDTEGTKNKGSPGKARLSPTLELARGKK